MKTQRLKFADSFFGFYTPVRTVLKSFPVTFKFAGTPPRLVTCVSEKEANIRSAVQDVCETLGSSTIVPPATQPFFVQWDPVTQRCTPRAITNKNCGSGYTTDIISGLNNNSDVVCRSVVGGLTPNSLVNKTEVNCGTSAPIVTTDSDGLITLECSP